MRITSLLKKLFIGGEWGIAYKKRDSLEYQVAKVPEGYWAADPLLFEYKGIHYLFAEIYEKQKGRAGIGYFEFENDIPIYKGIVIENDYHMSYPCVFKYRDTILMIPESSANMSLDLYIAEGFPNVWRKKTVLVSGCNYVDTTAYVKDDTIHLFSYHSVDRHWELVHSVLDYEKCSLTLVNNKPFEKNSGRPAGYFIDAPSGILRPAQNCLEKYGESIFFYHIDSLEPYSETLVNELRIEDIQASFKAQRIHTYTEDSCYQCVDFFVEQFELFHAIEIYKRSHLKKREND